MKAITKSPCPPELQEHLIAFPADTWNSFTSTNSAAHTVVKENIKQNQLGICCYCEIDFSEESHTPDFRVEHFYPKSKSPRPDGSNAHLAWDNLLGSCHGGSEKYKPHVGSKRYTSPDLHCDAIKKEKNLTNVILNPLDLRPDDKIFKFDSNGDMAVDSARCPPNLVVKAENTIKELNLNQRFLSESRKEVRASIVSAINDLVIVGGIPMQQVQSLLHKALLVSEKIPKFYSCKFDAIYY